MTQDSITPIHVVGGGLASIDVAKILMLETTRAKLVERGIDEPMVELEVKGIPKILERHGLAFEDLGLTGCTIYYRRDIDDHIVRTGASRIVQIVSDCRDMPAAYMLADVVVSASTDPEAFGRVAAEAQAMGRPVIATDHGGARETVVPGDTGWLVPPGDPDALADALGEALAMTTEQRSRMACNAIGHVNLNFSRTKMCAETLQVYHEVLNMAVASEA